MLKTNLPPQLYIPLQRDFVIARDFFEYGPQDTRDMALRAGLRKPRISKARMDRMTAKDTSSQLTKQFTRHG